MLTFRKFIKSSFISMMVSLQVFASPAMVLASETAPSSEAAPADSTTVTEQPAESATATSTSVTPVGLSPTVTSNATTEPTPQTTTSATETPGPTAPTGVQAPTGADSSTYTKNEDGTWGNDTYIWDPATGQTRPKVAPTYSFNPTTQMWDTTEWYFSPESGKYLPNVVSVAQNPLLTPLAANTARGTGASIGLTGPNSNNSILLGGDTTGTFDMFFDARISNAIGQMSRSGNATVQGSTIGGSASSGDANSIANILNLLQSSWGTLGSDDISTFVANIDGDVVGDLFVDPSALASGSGNTELDVNIARNGQINNDVNLDSQSGDALVSGNTVGGDARTGSSSAVANLMNLINSAINARRSFVGVLNINGNLEGDILLPEGLLQSIIAASGPSSNNTISGGGDSNLSLNVDSTRSINNNVTTDASTGDATVGGNTSGGTATTGSAQNNVTLLNLTGQRVVAKNAMLVFVNVFGTWVGLIMNAPAGTNAIAATGPDSTNTIVGGGDTNIDVDVNENSQINNNVRTTARSGDADVTGNTVGGNASSGDAAAGANILNMIDSSFDISDWFGVLFINVFGTWLGSFGVDTAYGDGEAFTANGNNTPANNASNSSTTNIAAASPKPSGVFSFIPQTFNRELSTQATTEADDSSVAAATDNAKTTSPANASNFSANPTDTNATTVVAANWTWTVAGVTSALSLLGLERFLTLRRRIT